MTSATHVSAALNSLQTFDNGKPEAFLMRRFGISEKAIRTLFEKPTASLYVSNILEPIPHLKSIHGAYQREPYKEGVEYREEVRRLRANLTGCDRPKECNGKQSHQRLYYSPME